MNALPAALLVAPFLFATSGYASAGGEVDLELRYIVCGDVGDVVDVDLWAVLAGTPGTAAGAVDAILSWDPSVLELVNEDSSASSYAWLVTGFLPDIDGINLDLTDGDALLTALANPTQPAIIPPSPGVLVSSLRFTILVPTNGSQVSFLPTLGTAAQTRVLDFFIPGTNITNDITEFASVSPCQVSAPYCGNTPNSTGVPGLILGLGSNVVAEGTFSLAAVNLPTNQFSLFVASSGPGLIDLPAQGVSNGFLCLELGPNLGRFNSFIQNTGVSGTVSIPVDLDAVPIAAFPGTTSISPGTTWYFQCWHREAGGSSNFTNAISVDFE